MSELDAWLRRRGELTVLPIVHGRLDSAVLASSDLVVHVGPSAPASNIKHLAARRGRRLVHLPIGALEPAARLRLRTVHLLFGKKTRETAGSWIRR